MIVYAAVMCLLFPIGVPLYYAAALFRSRNELHEIRRLELKNSAALTAIKLRAAELAAEEASKFIEQAQQANQASTEKYKKLRRELPSTLRKLTAGYEMRCFWFEIFECVRKILLVGLPVFFEPGTPGQLILGLVIAFLTFGAYCAFAPYERRSDDVLSAVCQVTIFFSLVASIVTNAFPNDPAMSVLLPALLFLPPTLSMLFEIEFFEYLSSMLSAEEGKRPGWLGRPLQRCLNACVNRLDRLLGTPEPRSSSWHHSRVDPPDGTFPEEQEVLPPTSLKRDNLPVAMRGAGARNRPSLLFWLRSSSHRKLFRTRAKVKEADATKEATMQAEAKEKEKETEKDGEKEGGKEGEGEATTAEAHAHKGRAHEGTSGPEGSSHEGIQESQEERLPSRVATPRSAWSDLGVDALSSSSNAPSTSQISPQVALPRLVQPPQEVEDAEMGARRKAATPQSSLRRSFGFLPAIPGMRKPSRRGVGQGGASAAAIAPIEYSPAALPAVESQTAARAEKPVESAPAGRSEEPSQPQESRKLQSEMEVADLGMEVEDLESGLDDADGSARAQEPRSTEWRVAQPGDAQAMRSGVGAAHVHHM